MKLIMENWNKFVNEEEQVEEGIMDSIKGFFGKDEPEQEADESFDQEAALRSLNDAIRDQFFMKAFVIPLYFYYIKYSPNDRSRSDLAREFLSRDIIRKAMMDATATGGSITDRRSAMEFLNTYFGDKERNTIADYIRSNKIEKALELPDLETYVFSEFDKSFAADHILKYFAEPEGRGRTQYGHDVRDYGYGYKQYRG